ncbi:MAG: ribosome biogenesis GTPase Der [Candidatus Omnitrophica bacterium]|nr:ribosome biogenesis GTPase Der [Candidatus Omnitrophota bacterium]
MAASIPIVSIVGRPNVGKSSLFNRIVKKRHAVVEEREGTTRDRIEKHVKFKGKNLILVDTGGFFSNDFLRSEKDRIEALMKMQIKKAIMRSDLLLFVCDSESGPSPLDLDMVRFIRKSGKKIVLVVNKIDNEKKKESLPEFYELGLGEPFGISCLHNRGINDLTEEIARLIPEHSESETPEDQPIKVAIVGRPNVGKSSFLNRVLDEERVIVHEKPGTTRDSIDTYLKKDGINFLLIDTAGLRHKKKVKTAVDIYSMMRARSSIDHSDVALLLIDGMEGVTSDDTKIFDYIVETGKGCAIVVNKWDLVKGIETSRYAGAILKKMPQARNFPVAFISAKTGRNVSIAFNLVNAIKTNLDLSIDKDALNDFLKEISPEEVRIPRRRRPPRFFHMAQAGMFPKEFAIFVSDPHAVTGAHSSFIENRLRENFPLKGVPIKLFYRKRPKKGKTR